MTKVRQKGGIRFQFVCPSFGLKIVTTRRFNKMFFRGVWFLSVNHTWSLPGRNWILAGELHDTVYVFFEREQSLASHVDVPRA